MAAKKSEKGFKVDFLGDTIEVTMWGFEKLNNRAMERAWRQIRKERRRLIKLEIRNSRVQEKEETVDG